jgi:hypothetical protein
MMQPYLPEWLPWWAPALILVPLLFLVLAFLAMPFSVFGIKGRLEEIEARLDEIQGEIRSLAFRLPEPDGTITYRDSMLAAEPEAEEEPEPPPRPRTQPERAARLPATIARPPIPPIPPMPRQEQPDFRPAEEEDEAPPAPRPRQYRPIFRRPQAERGSERGSERGEPAPAARTEPRLDWPR